MDRAPYLLPQGRWGARMGDITMFDSILHDGLNDAFTGKHSGLAHGRPGAEERDQPQDQDRWAEAGRATPWQSRCCERIPLAE